MTQIAAAENLSIDANAREWRLLTTNENRVEDVVLRAAPGEPLTFSSSFAVTRRLPTAGKLPTKYVRRVVVGWSHDDDSWHLGLLLDKELADIRGSRWCEIATWPDPDPVVFGDLAQQAGQTLAETLDVPLNLVPPRPPEERPVRPPKPAALPALPLQLEGWRLEREADGRLLLRRGARWRLRQVGRILWYAAWSMVFTVLSVATLEQDLALPNSGVMLPTPDLLPYLGIIVVFVLVGITLFLIRELVSRPDRLVFDASAGRVQALRGRSLRWSQPLAQAQSVYVTHVLRRKRGQWAIQYSELNLHLGRQDFRRLLEQRPDDEIAPQDSLSPDSDAVQPLQPAEPLTTLQAAGLHIAQALGLPCYYDQRER